MSALAVSAVVFVTIFGAAMVAMFAKRLLPEHHLSVDSKDSIRLGMGVVATLAALVLGLLIASAKGTYDAQNSAVQELSAKVILLDRVLAGYGPDTKESRDLLRTVIEATRDRIWPEEAVQAANLAPGEARVAVETMYYKVADLSAQNDAQRALKARALEGITDMGQERLRLFSRRDSSLPTPFLVVLTSWLVILFSGYGLTAPRNGTVVVVLCVCAFSVSGAIFLILELSTPFAGLLRLSSGPIRDAIALLGS